MVQETKGQETVLPPDPAVEVATIRKELDETKAKLEQTQKGYSTAQQTLTEKDKELKRRLALEDHIGSLEDRIELLATAISIGRQPTDESFAEVAPQQRQDVLGELRRTRVEQEAKRKKSEKDSQEQEFATKVTSYQQRALAVGLTDKDRKYWDIARDVKLGLWEAAEIELGELETQKAQQVPAKRELTEKEEEEAGRKWLEKHGQLKTDTGGASPSVGQKWTMAQVKAMPQKEYVKNFPKGTLDVMDAIKEGRVKE